MLVKLVFLAVIIEWVYCTIKAVWLALSLICTGHEYVPVQILLLSACKVIPLLCHSFSLHGTWRQIRTLSKGIPVGTFAVYISDDFLDFTNAHCLCIGTHLGWGCSLIFSGENSTKIQGFFRQLVLSQFNYASVTRKVVLYMSFTNRIAVVDLHSQNVLVMNAYIQLKFHCVMACEVMDHGRTQ